jgi:hypothetical protein
MYRSCSHTHQKPKGKKKLELKSESPPTCPYTLRDRQSAGLRPLFKHLLYILGQPRPAARHRKLARCVAPVASRSRSLLVTRRREASFASRSHPVDLTIRAPPLLCKHLHSQHRHRDAHTPRWLQRGAVQLARPEPRAAWRGGPSGRLSRWRRGAGGARFRRRLR